MTLVAGFISASLPVCKLDTPLHRTPGRASKPPGDHIFGRHFRVQPNIEQKRAQNHSHNYSHVYICDRINVHVLCETREIVSVNSGCKCKKSTLCNN
jgi:hypothetical protein